MPKFLANNKNAVIDAAMENKFKVREVKQYYDSSLPSSINH